MIFNSDAAEQLYINYIRTKDVTSLEKLHLLANDLIKVIALSLNRDDYYDDLVQEGHLKLHQIIQKHQFRTDTPAAMYTFLSKVLRNHMIDYLRKSKPCVNLDSIAGVATFDANHGYDTSYRDELFDHYYPSRFPTLDNGYAYASYVYEAVQESITRNKIVNTLMLNPLNRAHALFIYRSVNSFLCITSVMTITPSHLLESLKYATNGNEFTLYPECVLMDYNAVLNYKQLIAHVSKMRAILRAKTT